MRLLKGINDRDFVEKFLQDLKVRARDIEDYFEKRKIQKIIDKFQLGMYEEYGEKY